MNLNIQIKMYAAEDAEVGLISCNRKVYLIKQIAKLSSILSSLTNELYDLEIEEENELKQFIESLDDNTRPVPMRKNIPTRTYR